MGDIKADTYPEAEIEARREAMLQAVLATPHKPQRPIKGKRVESRGKNPALAEKPE